MQGALGQVYRYLTPGERELFEAGALRAKLVNVWRPLCDVVKQWPLAFCDRRTVCEDDMVEVDRPASRFVDYGCYIRHNPSQKWYWLSNQYPSEPYVFLVWDSASGVGAPHGAFINPDADCELERQSTEVRLLVLESILPAT